MSDISYDVLCDVYSETLTGFFYFCSLWEANKLNYVQKVVPLIITFIE